MPKSSSEEAVLVSCSAAETAHFLPAVERSSTCASGTYERCRSVSLTTPSMHMRSPHRDATRLACGGGVVRAA